MRRSRVYPSNSEIKRVLNVAEQSRWPHAELRPGGVIILSKHTQSASEPDDFTAWESRL